MDVKETGNPGGQLVLAGDPRQLGPVLRSPLAQKHGLGYSLLERLLTYNSLYKKGPDGYDPQFITKLLRNYRYHCPLPCCSSHVVPVAVSWKRAVLFVALFTAAWFRTQQVFGPMVYLHSEGHQSRKSLDGSAFLGNPTRNKKGGERTAFLKSIVG